MLVKTNKTAFGTALALRAAEMQTVQNLTARTGNWDIPAHFALSDVRGGTVWHSAVYSTAHSHQGTK